MSFTDSLPNHFTGARRLTLTMLTARDRADDFKGLPLGSAKPMRLLAAFQEAEPYLGLPAHAFKLVSWLVKQTMACDWEEGSRPIAWPSARRQQEFLGLSAARQHQFSENPSLQLYLEMMASLGSGFDQDPQYTWLRPFLDSRQDMSNVERARFLHFHTIAYMRRAYGDGNQFVRAAAQRALEQLVRFVGPAAAAEIRPLEILKWLHPQRLDFVESSAADKLAAAARNNAATAGLPVPQGSNVLLILAFLFGASVSTDPLYPWVSEAMKSGSTGAERLNRLVEATKLHLADVLAG